MIDYAHDPEINTKRYKKDRTSKGQQYYETKNPR